MYATSSITSARNSQEQNNNFQQGSEKESGGATKGIRAILDYGCGLKEIHMRIDILFKLIALSDAGEISPVELKMVFAVFASVNGGHNRNKQDTRFWEIEIPKLAAARNLTVKKTKEYLSKLFLKGLLFCEQKICEEQIVNEDTGEKQWVDVWRIGLHPEFFGEVLSEGQIKKQGLVTTNETKCGKLISFKDYKIPAAKPAEKAATNAGETGRDRGHRSHDDGDHRHDRGENKSQPAEIKEEKSLPFFFSSYFSYISPCSAPQGKKTEIKISSGEQGAGDQQPPSDPPTLSPTEVREKKQVMSKLTAGTQRDFPSPISLSEERAKLKLQQQWLKETDGKEDFNQWCGRRA